MTTLDQRLQDAVGDVYRIERELARGGMSQLFLATEASLNRQVVIKLLPPEMASAVSAARFKQEMEVAAQLQHPHVLPVLSAGARHDLIYYVMPFVAGESLRTRLNQEGKLEVDRAVRILSEVADALAYAHEHGVVHRDIKPENILLQQDHAVLTDFGVARAVEQARGGERLTELGVAVGTPGYMSPEQAAGDRDVDSRADVYALAIVGYEMLTGAAPFTGPTAQAVLAAHLTQDANPVHEVEPTTPSAVSAAIAKALAKDPAERFQSAAAFRDALRAATSVPATGRRSSRLPLVAAAMLLVIAAGFVLWPRGYRIEGDPRQSIVVFPFENKTGAPENDYLEDASMNLLGLAVGHWEDMRVYDDERTGSLLRRRGILTPAEIDFDAARAMAREARVGTLVLGDIRREGSELAIEAKVHDVASGDRIATELVRATPDGDPRPLFDSLAARILRVSGAPAGERPDLLTQTTQSLEAYRQYLFGTAALQLLEIDSAKAHLRRAVALDSTFALAYIRLVDADGWAGVERASPAERRELIAKATAYSERLPPRYRQLLRFHAAYESGQLARARRIAEEMIAHDSSDVEAWYQYGEAHWHHGAGRFPHPDSLGNMGKALGAFEQTLRLDSGYVLAYLHLTDVLGSCANDNPWLCLLNGDSAVYGTTAELVERYGQERVDRLRAAARDRRLEAGYAWVGTAPSSERARNTLINMLLERELYAEAESQIAVLRANGQTAVADGWEARRAFEQAEYAEAGAVIERALSGGLGGFRQLANAGLIDVILRSLAGAARFETLQQVFDILEQLGPGDTINANNVVLSKRLFRQWFDAQAVILLSADSAIVAREARGWLDTLAAHYEPGTAAHEDRLAQSGSTVLIAYLVARDSSLLSQFLADIDTTGSRTWRPMLAHLAFARGDTTTARARITAHFERRDELELRNQPGSVRLVAWADLMARLGQPERATQALEIFETDEVGDNPWGPMHVRSWAERGALYQALGDTDRALEMYERFIEAWQDGGTIVQPQVQRAREALAALHGETRSPRR